jgi:hypothetical protein
MAGMLKSPCVLLCQNWFVGKLTIYHLRLVPIMLKKTLSAGEIYLLARILF